jgi:D-xylulose 5-phosphate/D-fructose 6-phosphate phosphoketolase
MSGFKLQPLGMLMEPDPGNPQEVEGVLNPAAARCPDGELYLFPRLVARGNYSRIGIARVGFNKVGEPVGVERRNPIPSLNLLLTSTCWRNDHNGFSHQSPGLIDTEVLCTACGRAWSFFGEVWTTMDSQIRYGFCAPTAHPSSDT